MRMLAGQQNGGQQHSLDATTHAQLDRRFWHDSDRAQYPLSGRFRGQTGKHLRVLSLKGFRPKGNSEASLDLPTDSRRPRDGSVVSFLHCMNDPQPEGSHGKLHPTTKILSHARRGGSLAARGARAATRTHAAGRLPTRRATVGTRTRGAPARIKRRAMFHSHFPDRGEHRLDEVRSMTEVLDEPLERESTHVTLSGSTHHVR